jgi:hypothetical protein
MIALATVDTGESVAGNQLEIEITIEAVRYNTRTKVAELPFYNPPQKTAVPV